MSILFGSFALGEMEIRNRFVSSACEDNLATDDGMVTDAVIRKFKKLAKGEVGLIVSSHVSVHPWGRSRKRQMGIHSDHMIPGLRKVVEAVHKESGKIVFQLGHAGLCTTEAIISRSPLGPSGRNGEMDEGAIRDVIDAFGRGAERAAEASADGVQVHAAHGYLISEFLSPFFNRRTDSWGGSEENRFRLLGEIIRTIRKRVPKRMAVLVKMNAHDHTPEEGTTPPLAVGYAKRLAELGIDALEVSCGTSAFSPWNMCRGDVPEPEILRYIPEAKRPKAQQTLEKLRGRFPLEEGYNLQAARMLRPVMGRVPLFAVGGWRHFAAMEQAVSRGDTDLISLCRPLIREPLLVRRMRQGKISAAACESCNRCLIAVANDLPVRCYFKGLPQN